MPLDRRRLLGAMIAAPLVPALGRNVPPADAAPVVRFDDSALAAVVDEGATLLRVHAGGRWCEGPVWAPRLGGLVFSDVRLNRLLVLPAEGGEARVLADPSDNANGNVLDAAGRLVTCEHRTRRVVRREADGRLTVLADRFEGRRLNSPNDAALGPGGAIWFTDPVFGIRQPDEGLTAEPEQAARRVYRIDPGTGAVTAMTDALDQPNGLAFSPDGRILYVADAGAALNPEGARAVHAFDLTPDGTLSPGRPFLTLDAGVPDGLAVDADGRLYVAAGDGCRVVAPDGRALGRIATPTPCANLAFDGGDGRRLFLCAGAEIFAIDLKVAGARPVPA